MKSSSVHKITKILFLFLFCFSKEIFPIPINNPYDPFFFYNVRGSDKFYNKGRKFEFNINLSPFYQHSAGARDKDGNKVPEGDRLGRWNMIATFFDADKAAPTSTSKVFSFDDTTGKATGNTRDNYHYFSRARRILDGLKEAGTVDPCWTDGPPLPVNPSKGQGEEQIDKWYYLPSEFDSFDPPNNNKGFLSVPIKYEKMGIRGEFKFDFGCGVGVNVKSGIVECKQRPTFNDKTGDWNALTTSETNAKAYIQSYLTGDDSRKQIMDELGLSSDQFQITTMEDTYFQFYCTFPFDVRDKNDEHVVTYAPYFSLGLWTPTGKERDMGKAFSIPVGNDGHWAGVIEGALDFDFPGTVQFSFGGGGAFFWGRDLNDYYVPSHKYQSGIYPWKANIRRKPGPVWYVNAAFKAYLFTEFFSFFFDYIYIQHNKDSVDIRTTNVANQSVFQPEMLEEDSKWKSNIVHAGLNYIVSEAIEMGLSCHFHLSGAKVYKTTSVLGTIKLSF